MSLKENIDTIIHDQLLFSSMISYCGYTIIQGVSSLCSLTPIYVATA